MKKIVCLILSVFLTLSLWAGIGGGYSISPVGEKFGDENFGGAAISGYFSPTGLKNIGKIEGDILFSMKSPVFRGVNLTISTPIYQTVDHPFNYVFSNVVLWQPTIGLGMEYRRGNDVRAMVEISPFVFQDAAFMYEILSPYISFDFNGNWGWGITVMKFSASFGRLN